jgi:hypothetical protein
VLRHKSIVMSPDCYVTMEMYQTHCHATELLRYYGNATGCMGHATKETQHVTI